MSSIIRFGKEEARRTLLIDRNGVVFQLRKGSDTFSIDTCEKWDTFTNWAKNNMDDFLTSLPDTFTSDSKKVFSILVYNGFSDVMKLYNSLEDLETIYILEKNVYHPLFIDRNGFMKYRGVKSDVFDKLGLSSPVFWMKGSYGKMVACQEFDQGEELLEDLDEDEELDEFADLPELIPVPDLDLGSCRSLSRFFSELKNTINEEPIVNFNGILYPTATSVPTLEPTVLANISVEPSFSSPVLGVSTNTIIETALEVTPVEPVLPTVEATLPLVEPVLPTVEATLPLVEPVLPTVEATLPLGEPVLPTVEATLPLVEPVLPTVEPVLPTVEPNVEPVLSTVEATVEAVLPTVESTVEATLPEVKTVSTSAVAVVNSKGEISPLDKKRRWCWFW